MLLHKGYLVQKWISNLMGPYYFLNTSFLLYCSETVPGYNLKNDQRRVDIAFKCSTVSTRLISTNFVHSVCFMCYNRC